MTEYLKRKRNNEYKEKKISFFFFISFCVYKYVILNIIEYVIILLFLLDMLAHSPKDRSRSPHRTNGTTVNSSSKHSSNQNETTSENDMSNNDTNTINNNSTKTKKENESQLRMKSLKVR